MWELEPLTSNSAFTAEGGVWGHAERERENSRKLCKMNQTSTQLPADSFKKQMTLGYSNHDSI